MLEDGQIVVFSRNSENMSAKYPDLVESIPKVRGSSFRLNSESLVCQQECQDVRDRYGGCCVRHQGEEAIAIPAVDNPKEERRKNRRYHSQSAYLCVRPALSERRGENGLGVIVSAVTELSLVSVALDKTARREAKTPAGPLSSGRRRICVCAKFGWVQQRADRRVPRR
jgi:hypothetical protein